MDERQLVAQMEELGLSNKEARVYLACLSLGETPVQRIAEHAGIKRVTTYVVLDALIAAGLVTQNLRAKRTFYVPEDPANLQRVLERREKELSANRIGLEQLVPKLKDLKPPSEALPSVRFFDSPDGLKVILEAFWDQARRSGETVAYGINNIDDLHRAFPEFKRAVASPHRLKLGIKAKTIYTCSEGPVLRDTDDIKMRESRWMPHDKFPLSGDYSVAGDHVLMLSLNASQPLGVAITSKDLAQGLRSMFDAIWESAAPYN